RVLIVHEDDRWSDPHGRPKPVRSACGGYRMFLSLDALSRDKTVAGHPPNQSLERSMKTEALELDIETIGNPIPDILAGKLLGPLDGQLASPGLDQIDRSKARLEKLETKSTLRNQRQIRVVVNQVGPQRQRSENRLDAKH